MKPRSRLAVAFAVLASLATRSAADVLVVPTPVNIHIASNSTLRTDTRPDVELRLPPGFFMDEEIHAKLDAELRRLQEQEVRLTAENASLRESASHYFPGWVVVGSALAVGLAGGIWLGTKL